MDTVFRIADCKRPRLAIVWSVLFAIACGAAAANGILPRLLIPLGLIYVASAVLFLILAILNPVTEIVITETEIVRAGGWCGRGRPDPFRCDRIRGNSGILMAIALPCGGEMDMSLWSMSDF